jgi:ATP-dependent RNA helicase RhlE
MPSYTSSRFNSRPSYGRNYSKSRPSSNKGPRKQYIHPSKFVKVATIQEQAPFEPKYSFEDLAINNLIKSNIVNKGYKQLSPIQDQIIPLALEGNDVIGLANTGTGKTAAFSIPILHAMLENPNQRAIVMAPTRELAQQIEDEFRSIGKGTRIKGALLIGGERIDSQIRDLRDRPQVVIGTPGRILDHIERRTLVLDNFTMAILDEVDRMLDMGFIGDIRTILSKLPKERQSLFFSATLDSRIETLINEFSNNPVKISVKTGDSSENVHQDIVKYNSKQEKLDKLHDILIAKDVEKIIVFDETQRSVERLSQELISRGFSAESIHGGKTQGQRKRAMDRFKSNQIKILVATDVAARGIDVSDITHVINFSVPQSYEDYIHRVGRAGRAGRIGYALTFVGE